MFDSQLLASSGGPLEYYLPAPLVAYLWALKIFEQEVLLLSVPLCNCSGLRLLSFFKISLKILLSNQQHGLCVFDRKIVLLNPVSNCR